MRRFMQAVFTPAFAAVLPVLVSRLQAVEKKRFRDMTLPAGLQRRAMSERQQIFRTER